jgi:hypothetical protein
MPAKAAGAGRVIPAQVLDQSAFRVVLRRCAARLILDEAGETVSSRDVGIGLRRDGDYEIRGLPMVPEDAHRHVQQRPLSRTTCRPSIICVE